MPKKIIVPGSRVTPTPRQIDSIDFDLARTDVIGFTFSLPVFWAVVLAAPGWRRNLRPLLAGTGLIALVELMLLLTFAATSAHKAAAAILSMPMGTFETWLLSFSDYLTVLVVPYLAPIVVAFAVHHELRRRRLRLDHAAGEILLQPQFISCGWQFPQDRAAVIRATRSRPYAEMSEFLGHYNVKNSASHADLS